MKVEWEEGDTYAIEIRIAGRHDPQVFSADSLEELVEQLATAHFHGSKKILELARETKKLRGIIARLHSRAALTPAQQEVLTDILQTWSRIAGLRARQSQ